MFCKWGLTFSCTNTTRCHCNLFLHGISSLVLPQLHGFVYQLSSACNKICPYIPRHILTRSKGSQTPWNMECALASMLHKISKPGIFSQPHRFSHIAFHIPGVTQYRHCRLNDKQRLLQETLGKWSLRILCFALTIPQVTEGCTAHFFQKTGRKSKNETKKSN